jgi:Skp family chaperone for outer membrane proteins
MKRIVKSVAIVVLSISSFALAQAQKVAHISVDSLISIMPESKTAEGLVVKHQKELETQVGSMQTELQSNMKNIWLKDQRILKSLKLQKKKNYKI